MDAAEHAGHPPEGGPGWPASRYAGDKSLRDGEVRDWQPPPGIVIAPAHPGDGRTEVLFETRTDADGRQVLPVFSSLRRLIAAFGPAQPWLALKLHTAREVAASGGLADVLVDPAVPPGAWRWSTQDLERLEQALDGPQSTDDPSEVRRS